MNCTDSVRNSALLDVFVKTNFCYSDYILEHKCRLDDFIFKLARKKKKMLRVKTLKNVIYFDADRNCLLKYMLFHHCERELRSIPVHINLNLFSQQSMTALSKYNILPLISFGYIRIILHLENASLDVYP